MRLVVTFLLLVSSMIVSGQTITSVKFVKLVADPVNPMAQDVYVAMDVQNDLRVPMTIGNQQFRLVDTQGNTYETSDIPFSGEGGVGLPVRLSSWSELPQRVNPGVAITPLVFFTVPPHVRVTDLKVCMDESCQDLGAVESAMAAAALAAYKKNIVQDFLSHWAEPTDVPVGAVTHLSVNIGASGNVYGATVNQTSEYLSLDQSCIKSLQQTERVKPPPGQTAFVLYVRCLVTAIHPYSFDLDDTPSVPPVNTQAETPPVTPDAAPDAAGVYHVGIGVTPPRLLLAPAPQFPAALSGTLPKGWQALVVVGLVVDAKGYPQQVHVVQAFGSGLDEKAVEAVKKYRFSAATVKDKPVPVEVNVEVNFKVY